MLMRVHTFCSLVCLVTSAMVLPVQAALPGLTITRLTSPEPAPGRNFGSSAVLTERFAVVSDTSIPSDLGIIIQGRVHVYDAATGKLLRTLKPTHPSTVKNFGRELAVHGHLLLVGCYTEQVFLFDLNTGKQLRTFLRPGPENYSFFGDSLELTDRHAIIAHPGVAVYAYELGNDNPPLALLPPDPNFTGWYATAIYSHDNLLLVGHLFDATNKGVVHRFDLTTGHLLGSHQAPAGQVIDRFGSFMAGSGQTAFVSNEANSGAGKAYRITLGGEVGPAFNLDPLMGGDRKFHPGSIAGNLAAWWAAGDVVVSDVQTLTPFLTITSTDLDSNGFIGLPALAANRLLLPCEADNGAGAAAGAVFLVQTLSEPLAGSVIAVRGEAAPGAADITFHGLNAAALDTSGRVVLASSLRGKGSNRGRDSAVFDDLANAGALDLVTKSRDDLGSGLRVASLTTPLMNNGNALFTARLGGAGVTAANQRMILRSDGTNVLPLLRTGQPLPVFSGDLLAAFGTVAQSASTSYFSTVVRLRGGATAANDSGLLMAHSTMANLSDGLREGQATGITDVDFAQFLPRVSHAQGAAAFTCMLSGPANANQGLFVRAFGGAPTLVARKGAPAPGITDAVFSSFLAENAVTLNHVVFRAKVSGPGIKATANEGLWQGPPAMPNLVARTGSQVPGMSTGVVWSRFLQVCPQNDRLLLRARLRGPGIKTSNDEVLCLYQENQTFLVLYREGEALPGMNGARGGAIRRLEAHQDGSYQLTIGLGRSSAATNLAWLGGSTLKSTPGSSLRRPELKLRKGTVMALRPSATAARLTTLDFAHPQTRDASGMSCKGLPSVTHQAGTLMRLGFRDRSLGVVRLP